MNLSYTKVKNPTDKDIKLNYKGENHFIGPRETKSFLEPVAKQWVTIYGFLQLEGKGEVEEEVDEIKEVEEEKVVTKKVTKKK